MVQNSLLKLHLLDFIRKADFNIADIYTQIEKREVPQDFLDFMLSDDDIPLTERERLKLEKTIEQLRTDFEHTVVNDRGKELYLLPSSLQSDGTRRVLGIETVIYMQLQKQAFLSIDELETSLHPDLMRYVIQRFLEDKGNRGQLLVTTHYDPLLNDVGVILRKDAVWFINKNESGHSELYSLIDNKGLNRISSFQKAYRKGEFKAIPNIKAKPN